MTNANYEQINKVIHLIRSLDDDGVEELIRISKIEGKISDESMFRETLNSIRNPLQQV